MRGGTVIIQLKVCCTCRQLNAEVPILSAKLTPKGKENKSKMEKSLSVQTTDPLLDELKESLDSSFHKGCVDTYLAKPSAAAIAQKALDTIAKAIDETK
jgi:hypothetical protein